MRTNLKLFRIKHKLSQQEMAEKIGYRRAMYSLVESGKREGRRAFWTALQAAFNVPDEEMFGLMKNDE